MANSPIVLCSECEAPGAKIIMLFTRTPYCGRYCRSEGEFKYIRMIMRAKAEGIDNGELAV